MIKEDGSTPASFPLVTFLGGGEGGELIVVIQ